MRTIRPSLILLFASLKSMLIFSQNSNVLNYLPADAKMIIKINPGRLSKQITWQELRYSKMFQEMMKDFPENGKEFLNDPARTGIDLSKGFFLVMPNNMTSQKLDPVFFAVPKDTAQIASMVRKIFPGKRTEKAGNGKLIVDKHTALAWNNQVIILTGDDAKKDSSNRTKTNNTELTRLRQLQDRMKMLLTTRQKTPGNETFASRSTRCRRSTAAAIPPSRSVAGTRENTNSKSFWNAQSRFHAKRGLHGGSYKI